jgi:peptide chain release factor 2
MTASFTCGGIFDLASKEARVKELETLMAAPGFWEDTEKAQKAIEEGNQLKAWTVPYSQMKARFSDVKELLPEAFEAGGEEILSELLHELDLIDKGLADLEIRRMLSRLYQRWALKRGWKVEVVDTVEGDVAGIKSITLKFSGDFAYGYAKSEKGVHRLVRISPFDSNAKRHTSFASIDVTPEITDDITIEIRPEDLRIDTYRSSGAGGQHVNKTDSAVRLTHLPSGIVVSCQTQRSQVQNKEACFKMLRSKLYEIEVTQREDALKAIGGEKKEIAWGSQIRNYVFQPYTLVKDTRTKVETGNIQAVMDGEIDDFVNAYLKEFG